MEILGLKTCDTCRKARKALPDSTFRDVRAAPLSAAEIAEALAAFGDKLVNRASTTWRGLSEEERARSPEALLVEHPTLMKRPLIRLEDGTVYLGWTPSVRADLGVD